VVESLGRALHKHFERRIADLKGIALELELDAARIRSQAEVSA
jgi:hypothetical protein